MPVISGVCSGSLFCAALGVAYLAYAESLFRQDSAAAIQRAARLDGALAPADYFERLARLDPECSFLWRSAALAANPRGSEARIARGLDAERQGRYNDAASDLLEAARLDRQFLPAWTLANYFFRRGDGPSFWIWARRAAALSYDDLRPLLQLAHAMEPNAGAALTQLGATREATRADLDYLLASGRFDDAQGVARRLLADPSKDDIPRLIETADRQIRAGHAAYALKLWNGLSPPLDPANGAVLSNGDLNQQPSGIAFDWRLPAYEGILPAWSRSQLAFSLTGAQPESCALLEQLVPLMTGRRYRLSFEFQSSVAGMRWDLNGETSPVLDRAPEWRSAQLVFRPRSSPHSELFIGHLRLIYRRELGTVRLAGQFRIRNLHMRATGKETE